MVSLTAVEDALAGAFPQYGQRCEIAVVTRPDEDKGEILIAVANDTRVSLEDLRGAVKAKGLTNLCVPRELRHVHEIPQVGNRQGGLPGGSVRGRRIGRWAAKLRTTGERTGTGPQARHRFFPRGRRWFLGFAMVMVVAGLALLVSRELLFSGPYRPPQALPVGRIVDLHVHTAGVGSGNSGCFISPSLRQSYKFGVYLVAFGVTREEIESTGMPCFFQRVSDMVSSSQSVGSGGGPGPDGAIDDPSESWIAVARRFLFPTSTWRARCPGTRTCGLGPPSIHIERMRSAVGLGGDKRGVGGDSQHHGDRSFGPQMDSLLPAG